MKTFSTVLMCALVSHSVAFAQSREDAIETAQAAVRFLNEEVSTEGGYLWRYSSDLKLREGEGVVKEKRVWVQPPGTPSLGEAFLDLYEASGDRMFLKIAKRAGYLLRHGQMQSGGWQYCVELDPERSSRWAYRHVPRHKKAKDQSSLDDNKTQSALHFLVRLDAALEFKDKAVHEAALYGLNALLQRGQLSNGGFPQVWTDEEVPRPDTINRSASYPETWPREYPGHQQYWNRSTLNDNLAGDTAKLLFLADETYQTTEYRDAVVRLADFLIASQMPMPQPAWCQQYADDMTPIWARKFEPPAITSSESFDVISTLMMVYAHTGQERYLEPIPVALAYLKRCALPDGKIARFYELKTNRPLYFDLDYRLTYDNSNMPTHYGFVLDSKVTKLQSQFTKIQKMSTDELKGLLKRKPKANKKQALEIIESIDSRGAWVTDGPMKYHNHPGPIIDMAKTAKNLRGLAAFIAEAE